MTPILQVRKMGLRDVLGLVQDHTALEWRGSGFLTPLPVASSLAHPVSLIQQIFMVTRVVWLMHRNVGGMNQGWASPWTAAMGGRGSSRLQGRGWAGLSAAVYLVRSRHWAPPGPSPGTLDTHHWNGRCL